MAFIDADKTSYTDYFERCLTLVRPGGLILLDNTLWGGSVADPDDQAEDTRAIRALNDRLLEDSRVTLSLVPIGDGLTLAKLVERLAPDESVATPKLNSDSVKKQHSIAHD